MAYSEFLLTTVLTELGLDGPPPLNLFPNLQAIVPPSWLLSALQLRTRIMLTTEKARSEFIVAPILSAVLEHFDSRLCIFSGERLDVDPARSLVGECDFLIGSAGPVRSLRAPLFTVVEAKRHDIEQGLGQCIAQMVGAQLFNERQGQPIRYVFGCVTTGDSWQFLRLQGQELTMHDSMFFIDQPGLILAAFLSAIRETFPATPA
jgi:hypothetical protein